MRIEGTGILFVALVVCGLSLLATTTSHAADEQDELEFTQTNSILRGDFLRFWRDLKANPEDPNELPRYGYPITNELVRKEASDTKGYVVQYFERAVFVEHPENHYPDTVEVERLGEIIYKQVPSAGVLAQVVNKEPGPITKMQALNMNGFWVGGKFADFYFSSTEKERAWYGKPISNEFDESNFEHPEMVYRVQYFENVAFELHPDDVNQPVQLMLLGKRKWFADFGHDADPQWWRSLNYLSIILLSSASLALILLAVSAVLFVRKKRLHLAFWLLWAAIAELIFVLGVTRQMWAEVLAVGISATELQTWSWLTTLVQKLSNNTNSTEFAAGSAGLLVAWSLVVLGLALYVSPWHTPKGSEKSPADDGTSDTSGTNNRAENTPEVKRARLRYLIIWIAGVLVLAPGVNELVVIFAPSLASTLMPFASTIPAISIWTALLFLAFLYTGGDNSEMFNEQIHPYHGIWAAFSVVLLVTILTGVSAYQSVSARVNGDLAQRTLAQATLLDLQSSTADLNDTAHKLTEYIDESSYKNDGSLEYVRNVIIPGLEYVRDVLLPELEQHVASAKSRVEIAEVQVKKIAEEATNTELDRSKAALSGIQGVLAECKSSIEAVDSTVTELAGMISTLVPSPTEGASSQAGSSGAARLGDATSQSSASFADLRGLILTKLVSKAYDANIQAQIASRSAEATSNKALTTFLLLGSLYVVLVLFPWLLLLLFIYRKRSNRAAQIYHDLMTLDPQGRLLSDVLQGEQDERVKQDLAVVLEELLAAEQKLGTGRSEQTDPEQIKSYRNNKSKIIQGLARQAFGNFEYVLILLFLSALIAVGWYYMFYPGQSQGLAVLIESGGGVRQLAEYIIRNITPITLGFVGAYFFQLHALLRRYLSNDLYPAAFLEACQRFMLVFILSIVLNFSALSGESGNTSTPGFGYVILSVTAFFVGIFPSWGLTLLRAWLGRMLVRKKKVDDPSNDPGKVPGSSDPENNIPTLDETSPLSKLAGLNIWTVDPFLEQNVSNVESLATASFGQLVSATHFTTARLVDWVDQALLYSHSGNKGQWFEKFRDVGICTASQLLMAVGCDLNKITAHPGATPNPNEDFLHMERLYNALMSEPQPENVNSAPGRSHAAKQAGKVETSEKVDSQNDAAGSSKQGPSAQERLTLDLLRTICISLWSENNLRYISNFRRYQPTLIIGCPGAKQLDQTAKTAAPAPKLPEEISNGKLPAEASSIVSARPISG